MEHVEQLEELVQSQKQALQDPKVHRVMMAHLAPQATLVQEVEQVTLVHLVQQDLQDNLEIKDQLVFVVLKELLEQKD